MAAYLFGTHRETRMKEKKQFLTAWTKNVVESRTCDGLMDAKHTTNNPNVYPIKGGTEREVPDGHDSQK